MLIWNYNKGVRLWASGLRLPSWESLPRFGGGLGVDFLSQKTEDRRQSHKLPSREGLGVGKLRIKII